jgi:hypothetical protein
MLTLLSERFAPITSSIGFLELPLDEAAAGVEGWRRRLHGDLTASRPDEGFPDVLRQLEPLIGGSRPRELLVAAGPRWTAYFDCGLRGTDAVSAIGYLSRTLQCQGLAVRCCPHTADDPGVRPGRMGAVQFELFGPLKTGFLNYVRTVSSSFDGSRWVFNATGTEQAFEEPEAYRVRRVRDRFTSERLERYCRALGIEVFDPAFYGPAAVLLESAVPPAPDGYVMSLQQAQEWLGIVPGMADGLLG